MYITNHCLVFLLLLSTLPLRAQEPASSGGSEQSVRSCTYDNYTPLSGNWSANYWESDKFQGEVCRVANLDASALHADVNHTAGGWDMALTYNYDDHLRIDEVPANLTVNGRISVNLTMDNGRWWAGPKLDVREAGSRGLPGNYENYVIENASISPAAVGEWLMGNPETEYLGTTAHDGATYKHYFNPHNDWYQYWAVRQEYREAGPVSIKPIVQKWRSHGMRNDYIRNVRFNIEAFRNGQGSVTISEVSPPLPGQPTPGETDQVRVRARGTTGLEQIEVRYNDQRVGEPITLSTSYQEYSVPVNEPSGNFKVAFINDQGPRDVFVDWLQLGDERRQAEEQAVNTGAWGNGECGGGTLTEALHCNGYIDFGTMGDEAASGNILIRAKSSQGNERMDLAVDGQIVKSWSVTTAPNNYVYEGYSGGEIKVVFDDDGGSREDGTDRNLGINYIDVCGTRYENNAPGVTRTNCGTDNERGFAWLYCNGELNFGDVGCNGNARQTVASRKTANLLDPEKGTGLFKAYPNPAHEQLTVRGGDDYQVTLYDLSGRRVLRQKQLTGQTQVDISQLRPGVYILRMRDSDQHELRQRVVVE